MAAAMDPAAWVALIMLHVLDVKTMAHAVYGGSDRAALIRVKAEKKKEELQRGNCSVATEAEKEELQRGN
jgi:hypothetical protein